jgi:glutathione synthase/RimK-type ligase-like ATP-grasp enzyme
MHIQRVHSKWAKTKALVRDPLLKPYVPETRPFSKKTLKKMLDRLKMVYIKPVRGTFGNGVIRIEKRNGRSLRYAFQSGEQKYRYASYTPMFRGLASVKYRRPYLVQQGIELLRCAGRRFDLRLMVQKNPKLQWESTGLIGRLAQPRKIVTNYHSGGTPMAAKKLLISHIPAKQWREYLKALNKLGILTAAALERKFPRIKEIGIDFAVDAELKPWILEVNTLPDPYIFRKLPDPSVFRRIRRYAVFYNKLKPVRHRRKR